MHRQEYAEVFFLHFPFGGKYRGETGIAVRAGEVLRK